MSNRIKQEFILGYMAYSILLFSSIEFKYTSSGGIDDSANVAKSFFLYLFYKVLPTEKQNDIGVFHIGYVKLDMLKSKRLEDIQVMLLNAPLMYDYYLSNRKMRIRLNKK